MIKIFHTADLHIGMKFKNYPEPIKTLLQDARVETLVNMVKRANEEKCNIFVIAGDLFDKINGIDKKSINRAANALNEFEGQCVIVMPGNHDYDNGMVDLWTTFNKATTDKIIFVNHENPYNLEDYGLNVVIYPAPCHAKHSDTNNLGWIKEENIGDDLIRIGIGHGALEGISPDMDSNYFKMTIDELLKIPMDIWLLGHTHITYPMQEAVSAERIFNPGTPEPDGLDCKHDGRAWLISIDEKRRVSGNRISTGIYRFIDRDFEVRHKEDLDNIIQSIESDKMQNTIARLKLTGKVDEETFDYRQHIYKSIEDDIAYLIKDDDDLGIRITTEKIHKEFSEGSFPHKLLSSFEDDEDTLQLAYELIMEVKNDH